MIWQEGELPDVVVEFLSPGTEAEDLGRFYDETSRVVESEPTVPISSSVADKAGAEAKEKPNGNAGAEGGKPSSCALSHRRENLRCMKRICECRTIWSTAATPSTCVISS